MQIHGLKNTDNYMSNEYTDKDTFKFFLRFVTRAVFFALLFIIVSISAVALIVAGDVFYNVKKGNNVVPLLGGYVIITHSMVPTIKVNDAVLVKRVSENELKIGDIITFESSDERYNGLVITHRIVGSQSISSGELVYRTKGDNNRIEDSAVVDLKNIYGKVLLKFPKLGYFRDFIKKPIGFALCILLPIILIILINFKNLMNREEMI